MLGARLRRDRAGQGHADARRSTQPARGRRRTARCSGFAAGTDGSSRRIPFWVDYDEIDAGAAAGSRYAREAGIALGTASLVSGYHNAAAAKPLVVTGRFADQAKLRALETSRWVFATARPGGMHRDGDGFNALSESG